MLLGLCSLERGLARHGFGHATLCTYHSDHSELNPSRQRYTLKTALEEALASTPKALGEAACESNQSSLAISLLDMWV
jgi:hypothetical protein